MLRVSTSYFLQLQPKRLQANDGGDELLLVALDTFDCDRAVGQLVGVSGLGGLGFGSLFLCVFCGSLLGVDGEGCRGGFECFCAGSVAEA